MEICGIVLAAGDSSRMGRPKALLPFDESTFLDRALQVFADAGITDYRVVAGKDGEAIRQNTRVESSRLLINSDPDRGQLSSLQLALEDIEQKNSRADAALMWLIDHPGVSTATVQYMISAFEIGFTFLRPEYQGSHGHPLLINSRVFGKIRSLPLQRGLKPLFSEPGISVIDLPVDDEAVLQDIDTPEAYKKEITDE